MFSLLKFQFVPAKLFSCAVIAILIQLTGCAFKNPSNYVVSKPGMKSQPSKKQPETSKDKKPKEIKATPSRTPVKTVKYITTPVSQEVISRAQKTKAVTNVDLAFCVDTSGSMRNFFGDVKGELEAVARDISYLQPAPRFRAALVVYGKSGLLQDGEGGYMEADFTDNVGTVLSKLDRYDNSRTGDDLALDDDREKVPDAVLFAIDNLGWNNSGRTLRMIYIAGNESPKQRDAVEVSSVCEKAREKEISINSIFCGPPDDMIVVQWQEVTQLGGGKSQALNRMVSKYAGRSSPDGTASLPGASPSPLIVTSIPESRPSDNPPVQRGGLRGYKGNVVGVLNDNTIIIKGAESKVFKMGNGIKYRPSSWRPSAGESVTVYVNPQNPDAVREIESND